jgi:outer membrane protein assembly factor BamB
VSVEAELRAGDPSGIGPYRLVAVLGSGGMGRVYLGRSPGGREVAVKVIRAELAADPEFRARFRREVAAARLVNGLYTAAVVDADTEGLVPWLATAYINAPSLADAVQRGGPLPPAALRALAAGLAEGLSAIHAAGVVHRDLKPSNVLLSADGPRVIDFGIAAAAEATSLTGTDVVVGSPGYLSPEQAEPSRGVGPASDMFSLGTVLCYAATGRSPWGTGSISARVYRVVHGEPDLADVPDEIRSLVERCMAKLPQDRPTATDLLAELGDPEPISGWLPPDRLDEVAGPALALRDAVSGTATWAAASSSGPPVAAAIALDDMGGQRLRSEVFGGSTGPRGNTGPRGGAPTLGNYPDAHRTEASPRIRPRRRRLILLAAVATAAAVLVPLIIAQAQSGQGHTPAQTAAPAPPALAGVYAGAGYGFNSPTSIAADGSHVWVLNGNYTVTELDARSGAPVQILKTASYGFNEASGITDDGTNVWVGDLDSVTEIDAGSGSLVRILRIPASVNVHGWPAPLVLAGTQLWGVTPETCRPLCGPGAALYATLIQFNASDGSFERVLMRPNTQTPVALASDGTRVWFASSDFNRSDPNDGTTGHETAGSVTEFDAGSGDQVWSAPVTIDSGQQETATTADSIAYADGRLWVANGQSVTELNASNGKTIRVLSGAQYQFTGQPVIAVAGTQVFVVNGAGNSVTEIDADTGAVEHTLTAARYHLDDPVGITVVGNHAWILNAPVSGASSVVELALNTG